MAGKSDLIKLTEVASTLLWPCPLHMAEFKASTVAFEVQKNFANKFFSNKVVVKGLIDDTSAQLLDNLYNLLFTFVSV